MQMRTHRVYQLQVTDLQDLRHLHEQFGIAYPAELADLCADPTRKMIMHIAPPPTANPIVHKTVEINAPTAIVWQALTDPAMLPQWMAESELEIHTDWTVGNPILIRGELHHLPFENKGTVLQFVPEQLLQYTHLSSLSHLPDQPESYAIVTFQLASIATRTALTVTVSNFPTEIIYKHLAFYWPVALGSLKRLIENQLVSHAHD